MKNTLLNIMVVGLLTASVAQADTRGVSDNEIVLGGFTPLSGPAAVWGVASTAGANLKFKQVNEAGGVHGRNIRLIMEDSQYQVPLAIQAVNKLVNRDKVFAMFGNLGTAHNLAVEKRLISQNVPNLFPFTQSHQLATNQHPLKFTWGSTYVDQTNAAVEHFVTTKGHKRVCVMYQDTDMGNEILGAAKDTASKHGAEVVATSAHASNASEFVGAMTSFKGAECDLIVFGTIIRDSIIGYATARKLGLTADIVAATPALSNIVAAADGGITEGLYSMASTVVIYRDTATGATLDFIEDYAAEYGKDPSVPAIFGYFWADLVVEGLSKAGRDLTVENFVAAMEQISDFQDIAGNPPVSFSADNHMGTRNIILNQVQNGRWVSVDM